MARMPRSQMEPFNDYDYTVRTSGHTLERSRTEAVDRCVDESQVVQGTVLWLPAQEDLPERAVRRAHGKGAIEEGIYNHPVVVVSRPAEDSRIVHFHLITSLQGRRLEELYSKSNEFHASRRSWYLPVSPTPDHPDAVSKKTKKRFPTLLLAHSARLRWESYVNIRHVYKIDISLLRAYSNPESSHIDTYYFERESMIRMLAKGKSLTLYEPGPQYAGPALQRARTEPTIGATYDARHTATTEVEHRWATATMPVIRSYATWNMSPVVQRDFRTLMVHTKHIATTPQKVPPDRGTKAALSSVQAIVVRPLEQLCIDLQSTAVVTQKNLASLYRAQVVVLGAPLSRAWRDFKGVTAIAIASL